jgi:ankyrin repeat protein
MDVWDFEIAHKMGFLKELLSKQKDFNTRDMFFGQTPLHWAAKVGLTEIAEFLISKGARVNIKDDSGETPLSLAARAGYPETVKIFIERGEDTGGIWSAFHWAAFLGNARTVKFSVETLDNIDLREGSGETALHKASVAGNTGIMELLIKSGADVNAKNSSGETPLHRAASRGRNESVKLLIKVKACMEIKDAEGKTPLHSAVEAEFEETARLLIENADINAKGTNGQTLLCRAVQESNIECINSY